MSASDKKQQRKAELADGLTQRQQKEQAEAQAAKRQKTIYTAVGVVCAVAAVALLVWNGLSGRDHGGDVAATVGGVDYTVADLQYYYVAARNSAYSQYQQFAAYGISMGYDPNVNDGEQWYNEEENKTYADAFRDNALEYLTQTAALCAEAKAQGYTLSEEGQAIVDEQLSSIDLICAQNGMSRNAYFTRVYGKGVTEKVFIRNLTNDVLASEYSDYHEEGISYDDAALEAYYDEHPDTLDSYDYRIFLVDGSVPTTDAEGNTVEVTDEEKAEAMAQAKEKADEAVSKLEATSRSDREETFIEIAPDYVAEAYKGAYAVESYSLQQQVLGSTLSSGGAAAASWLMDPARKTGDVTAVETTTGYQVVLFLDRYLVTDPTVNVRHILIKAESPEDDPNTADVDESQGAPTQEAMDAAKAEAEALLEEWKAGEATAESFGALADEHSDDGGSRGNGGRYTYISKGDMVGVFNDWIFDPARQSGDTGLVCHNGEDANYYGWHVIYFEKSEEPAWKGTAISAKQSTDQTEWLNGLTDATEAVAADGMKYVGEVSNAVPTPSASPEESDEPEESPAA